MTRRAGAFLLIVIAVCVSSVSLYLSEGRAALAYNQKNLVRLHVLANSDSEEDQTIKLRVRDAILKRLSPELELMQSSDQAYAWISQNQRIIADAVQNGLQDASVAQSFAIEMGVFSFPDRAYGDLFVPAGDYRALRVILGQGNGRNWWCVLFPPLCLNDLTTKTSPEKKIVTQKVTAQKVMVPAKKAVSIADEDSMKPITTEYRFWVYDWAKERTAQMKAFIEARAYKPGSF